MTSQRLPSTARDGGILIGILIVALVLRVWGIGFGLPPILARPDELEIVDRALRLLTGDLNPHFFHYPSLFFYLLGAVYAVWGGAVVLSGGSWDGFLDQMAADPSPAILVGRYVSAFLGVVTVWVVYRLARRIGRSERAGLVSAAFLAVLHLHVRDSHFATTDVALALFLTWAVLHIERMAEVGDTRSYVWAGIFTGFAISTKYVGIVLLGVGAFAHVARHWTEDSERSVGRRLRAAVNDGSAYLYPLAAAAAFAATTPYALVDPLFQSHFAFQMGHLAGGHGLDLGIGGIYHLRHTLPNSLGWPLFLTALVGAGWALWTHPKRAAVLLLFPTLFFLSTATGRTVFLRYMLPLVPFLCVAAGWFVAAMWARLGGRTEPWLAGIAVLIVVPCGRVIATDRALSRPDTRAEAAEWLVEQAEAGTVTVHQTGARWGWLDLPRSRDSLRSRLERAEGATDMPGLEAVRGWAVRKARIELRRGLRRPTGFAEVGWDSASASFDGPAPDWIVELRSPLVQYSRVPEALEEILTRDYTLSYHADTGGGPGSGWYDQHDAFYLPFGQIHTVGRPGPEVFVHRRTSVSAPDSTAAEDAR